MTKAKPPPAEELQESVEEFVAEHLPKFEPSLAPPKTSPKVVHDSLWGTLRLDPIELCFIDTPLVQRLRQVHQTGCAFFTYPCATHSRFEHTLGVMLQVQKLGDALLSGAPDENRLSNKDIGRLRLAALLHDVGHGPFSHTSEEVYGNLPAMEHLAKKHPSAKAHELLAYLILQTKTFREFCDGAADYYKREINATQMAKFITGECLTEDAPFMQQLLNGPFDADKLDYLIRDSHFSGLPLSLDLDRLWYAVRIGKAKGKTQLTVLQSGATPLEQILFSKMVLFSAVYHHHKVRAYDCMFAGIVERLRRNPDATARLTVRGRSLTWQSPVDFLWITEGDLFSFGLESKDEKLKKMIRNFFFRKPLKRALILSRKTVGLKSEDKWEKLVQLKRKTASCFEKKRDLARRICEEAGCSCDTEDVWVDLPVEPNLASADDTFIVPAEGIEPITLNDLIPTGKWTSQYAMNRWRGHVFCPPEVRDPIAAAAKRIFEEEYGVEIKPEAFQWCKVDPP